MEEEGVGLVDITRTGQIYLSTVKWKEGVPQCE